MYAMAIKGPGSSEMLLDGNCVVQRGTGGELVLRGSTCNTGAVTNNRASALPHSEPHLKIVRR